MEGPLLEGNTSVRHGWLSKSIAQLLSRAVGDGGLTVRLPDGSLTHLGNQSGPAIALESWATVRRILFHPTLAFGEAYMEGTLVPLGCDIFEVLDTLLGGRGEQDGHGLGAVAVARDKLARLGKRVAQFNPAGIARRNVAHHYDISNDFYRLLLDHDMQYSCAYFPTGAETLDEAQTAKKRHIAAKLRLDSPGLRVLDIGCGWGGMALTLARDYGAEVLGITLSEQQLALARERAAAAGLAGQVRFELLDYRAIQARFDRIVSVGMFEHVGITHYRAFFNVLRRCLEPDGVALLHAIGRLHGPSTTNPWMTKYVFPGGYSPALSEVLPAAERSGLMVTDIEILRMHYAHTLSRWRDNLARHRDEIVRRYDQRFLRMFEFYLAGAEVAFRRTGHIVWQMQLTRQLETLPITRDYLAGT